MRKILLIGLALILLYRPSAALANGLDDIPKEPPLSATAFVYCLPDGGVKLVALVVSYKDGKVIRFSAENMHGFSSGQELMEYGRSAVDKDAYFAGSCPRSKAKVPAGSESV